MSAPVVDMSLPSDEQLLTAANVNPRTEAARLTTTGRPEQVHDVGQQLRQAGTELDRAHEQSWRAQRVLAGSFANNGAPVHSADVHRLLLPAGFADAGTRLHDVGRRIGMLADELGSAISDLTRELHRLESDVSRLRSQFTNEVERSRGPDGLLAYERIAPLQARRATVAAELQELVDGCGRRVVERIGSYEVVVNDCLRLVGELQGPRAGPPDTTGTRLDPILGGGRLEGGGVSGLTVPAPPTPSAEVFPVLPPQAREPGFTPGFAGSGPLITVPAPELGAGRQDGPGSGQGHAAPPVRIDASTGRVGDPIAGGRPHRGDFPRTAGPNDILVRRGNDGKVNSYEVYDSDGLPVKRVDIRGRAHGLTPTPHVQEFERQTHPISGHIHVDKGPVRAASPDEVAGLS